MISKRNLEITKTSAATLGTVAGALFFAFKLASLATNISNTIEFPVSIGLGVAASVLAAFLERKKQIGIETTEGRHDENNKIISTSLQRIQEELGEIIKGDIEMGMSLDTLLRQRIAVEQQPEERYTKQVSLEIGTHLAPLEAVQPQKTLAKEISNDTEALSRMLTEASAARERIRRNSESRPTVGTSRSTQSVDTIGQIHEQLELARNTREAVKTQFNLFKSVSISSSHSTQERTPPSSTGADKEVRPDELEPELAFRSRSAEMKSEENSDSRDDHQINRSVPSSFRM